MYNGLEVRVPFCDYRLAEYAYNNYCKREQCGCKFVKICLNKPVSYTPLDVYKRQVLI